MKIKKDDSKYKSNLLSLVSHELNTPLSAILNASQLLEEKFDKQYVDMLVRNAKRLKQTVENMLELANADAGLMRVHLREVILDNVIRKEVDRLKKWVEKEKFSIELKVEEDLPNICADPVRLGRVLSSLVENAVKFSNIHGGTGEQIIHISLALESAEDVQPELSKAKILKKTGLFLVVSIASNLPALGELPNSFEDFFEPFSPWKDIYTREKDGMGVELALAREILMGHHGFISAGRPESSGTGVVFRFGLPVLSREDELEFVLNNRIHGAFGNLSKTSILVLRPDPESLSTTGNLRVLEEHLNGLLYRSSDSVFSIPSTGEVTIVMDDCDSAGAERLASRLIKDLKNDMPKLEFVWGYATGPDHGGSAEELLSYVQSNWRPA